MTIHAALPVLLLLVLCAAVSAQPPADGHGDPLPEGAVARFGTGQLLHGSVYGAEFAPDGKALATYGYNGARLWDVATGKDVSPPHFPRTGWAFVTFTPQGEHVVGDLRSCRVVDPATGNVSCSWRNPGRRPMVIVVAADGKSAATAWAEGGITVHDLTGPGLRPGRTVADEQSTLITLSGDGGKLAVGVNAAVHLWDVRAGRLLHTYTSAEAGDRPIEVALSPDGRHLAAGWWNKVEVYDTATHRPAKLESSGLARVSFLRFSPDGKHLDGASAYRAGFRWEVATGEQLAYSGAKQPTDGPYWDCALSPDGRTYAASSRGIRLWDTETWQERLPVERWPAWGEVVFLGPRTAAVVSWGGEQATVAVWGVTDGRLLRRHTVAVPADEWGRRRLSPDGKVLAAESEKAGVVLYDVETGKRLRTISPAHRSDLGIEFAFSPDGKTLVTPDSPRGLQLWDVASGKAVARLGGDSDGPQAFSPDGRTVASGFFKSFYLTEVASGRVRFQIPMPDPEVREYAESVVDRIRFARDGRKVAAFEQSGVAVFSTDRGRVLFHLADKDAGQGWDRAGSLSPDGRWLVHAVHPAGTLAVCDLDWAGAAQEFQALSGHADHVYSSAFSPDGKYLVTCGADGTAIVWDAAKFTGRADPPEADEVKRAAGEAQVPAAWLDEQWESLDDPDAAQAARVFVALAEVPDATVAYLGGKLKPARKVSAARINRLVAALDAETFAERQAAAQELQTIIDQAAPALRRALEADPFAEMKQNIEQLLAAVGPPLTDPDRLREVRAVELLERLGTPAARALLERLASGAPAARLTREAGAALARWR